MTAKELAKRLDRSESTIMQHFARTKKNMAKLGIIIDKVRGKNEYTLTYQMEDNDDSATIK